MPTPIDQPLDTPRSVLTYVEQALATAVDAAKHPWHWPAVATVLDNRIVVLRGYDPTERTWLWFTDRRSSKMSQLADDPRTVAVFNSPADRTQLRLYGSTVEVLDETQRAAQWATTSPRARANYLTEHPPGTVIERASRDLPPGWSTSDDDHASGFRNFCVLQTHISRADFLQLLPDGGALRSGWTYPDAAASFCWKAP